MPILSGRSTASLLILGDATVAPYNVVQPSITASGSVVEGAVLTRTNGIWKGALPITTSPQWTRNGVHIAGATSNTYTIEAADVGTAITCEVTATNNYGSNTSVASNSFTPQPSIPTGSIIMYNGANPGLTGWSRYAAADGLYIQGTATQAEITTTVAASGTISASYSLGTAGAHSSSNPRYIDSSANAGSNTIVDYQTAGNHTHTSPSISISLSAARPYTTEATLLIATQSQAQFPANTIHMRDTSEAGWTQKVATTATRNIRGGASGIVDVNRVSASNSATSGTGGAHDHFVAYASKAASTTAPGQTRNLSSTVGQSHTHTVTGTAFINNLGTRALKLWLAASAADALTGDMVMFAGSLSALPSYWKICDGTNGTVDMRDWFLGYSNSSATAHGATVNKTSSVSGTTSTNTWSHTHGASSTSTAFITTGVYHMTDTASHSHTVGTSGITDNYIPPSIKLAFIQYVPV